jgi:hypothetical protein
MVSVSSLAGQTFFSGRSIGREDCLPHQQIVTAWTAEEKDEGGRMKDETRQQSAFHPSSYSSAFILPYFDVE